MKRFFQIVLLGDFGRITHFGWAGFLTFMIVGAAVKAAKPDATLLALACALFAGACVAWVVYRFEFPSKSRPLGYNERRCNVEILSDPPPPPPR